MTEAKHTPGPWELHEQPMQFRSGEGIDFSIMQSDPVRCLVLLAAPGHATQEFRANARLIAAAPDMLAALQEVERAYDSDLGWQDQLARQMSVVRAAISKATGETK